MGSPTAAIRASRDAGLLEDVEAAGALTLADDRNLTVHTYLEDVAQAIFGRLPGHVGILRAWLARMEEGIGPDGQ
ncbi:MAG: hypothetical protein ACYDCL_00200 [Myxococcales bacterium]